MTFDIAVILTLTSREVSLHVFSGSGTQWHGLTTWVFGTSHIEPSHIVAFKLEISQFNALVTTLMLCFVVIHYIQPIPFLRTKFEPGGGVRVRGNAPHCGVRK